MSVPNSDRVISVFRDLMMKYGVLYSRILIVDYYYLLELMCFISFLITICLLHFAACLML